MSARRMVLVVLAALALVATPTALAEGIDRGFAGLGADAGGFDQAIPGTPLVFPRDFGAHPGFRTEWWYLTANLQDEAGTAYGVQWTLFRQAGAPGDERQGWANQTVWMGHAAVTTATEHLFAETFARGGVEQAGVTAQPFRAWIDDWIFEARQEALQARAWRRPGRRLRAQKSRPTARAFAMRSILPPTSLLFSMATTASAANRTMGAPPTISASPSSRSMGSSCFMEGRLSCRVLRGWIGKWSSQPLAATQKGWDWFSFRPVREKLMVFRLRDGTSRDFCAGTWMAPTARSRRSIAMTLRWRPLSETHLAGRVLPVRWKLVVKSHGIDVETTPVNAASWMATSFPYWEGPIIFHGSHEGKGYLEMTGY